MFQIRKWDKDGAQKGAWGRNPDRILYEEKFHFFRGTPK